VKKLLFLTLCLLIFQVSHSQTWKYSTEGNAFDGKYKQSYVYGSGGKFPYNEPSLHLTKYEKEEDINLYIDDAGSYDYNQGVIVYWIFDNEPDIRYKTIGVEFSADRSAIFSEKFRFSDGTTTFADEILTEDYLNVIDFIEKLKSASKVYVRIEDNYYGKKDLTFSLRGSTKALNYLLNTDW
jgi:hypothetical protein